MLNNNKIVILDLNSGNYLYLRNYLRNLNFDTIVTKKASLIKKANILFISGNSNTIQLMKEINKISNFNLIIKKKIVIAICSGFQIFSKMVEENNDRISGLNLITGKVSPFNKNQYHIGWNKIKSKKSFFKKYSKDLFFFSHGYSNFTINNKNCLAYSEYQGQKFCSVYKLKNIIGFQFHPEKSGESGKKLIMEVIKNNGKF